MNAFVTLLGVNRAKTIVAHLVHQTVEQDLGTTPVDTELSSRSVVIMLLDVLALFCAPTNTDHPQELVDIYRTVKTRSVKICAKHTLPALRRTHDGFIVQLCAVRV